MESKDAVCGVMKGSMSIYLEAIIVMEGSMRAHVRDLGSYEVMESKATGSGVMQGSIWKNLEATKVTQE